MMSQPGQKPRGGGIYRSPFHYTPKDVACEYCQNYVRKHPCRLCECTCLDERIEAGVLELNEFVRDCFAPSMGPQFRKRMHQQLRERNPQFFLSNAHRRRWTYWRERCWRLSDRNKAALFLLTAYESLWRRMVWKCGNDGFDFQSVRLGGIEPELYSVYQAAKAIAIGCCNITLADLASPELVTDEAFHLITGALLMAKYPDMTGFSPRNVRRMRDFWQLYSGTPELLGEALHLNWTQNIVIMEAELPAEERRWYIRQATARNLSKAELLRMIEDSAYLESVLDEKVDVWYNEGNDEISERTQYEEDPVYLSRQYLPQPHGRVRDEGLGKKGGTGIAISYRISGYQSGGDRQPSLSSGTAQAGRAWDLLRRPCRTAVDNSGLRRIRSPDRHGPGQPPGYVPYLRRRLCRQDVPPDGSHRPSRQCGRPMVHRGLRGDLAGCAGWLPRTFERIHDRTR